jgi:methionyl-tRNA formyltransferase
MNSKIVICGCTEAGFETLEFLLEQNITISYIVSLDDEQAKKWNVSGYCSFDKLSKKYNIPIYYPKSYSLKEKEDLDFFQHHSFDLLILGGWQRLIPDDVLSTLKIGGVGVHGSSEMLPKGRGRSPVNWSLIEGKNKYILQLFLMTPGIDDGDILDFQTFDINKWDTCRTLYYKISIVQKQKLLELIPKLIKNKFNRIPQTGEPTFYPKRTPDDGLINWNQTSEKLYDFIRAITKPYPGAFSYIDDKKILIWKSQPFDNHIIYDQNRTGEIVEKFSSGDFIVKCNKGTLLITEYDGTLSVGETFTS